MPSPKSSSAIRTPVSHLAGGGGVHMPLERILACTVCSDSRDVLLGEAPRPPDRREQDDLALLVVASGVGQLAIDPRIDRTVDV